MEYDKGVMWAFEYIRDIASKLGAPVETETLVEYRGDDGKVKTFGYLDAYCTGHLFDLKTGSQKRDYWPQMAVYGAALCDRDNLTSLDIHLLYSERKEVDYRKASREEMRREANAIIEAVENPTSPAVPCQYCEWCAHKPMCRSLNETAMTVAGTEMQSLPRVGDISKVNCPSVMAKLKDVASVAKAWANEVNKHANTFVRLDGYSHVTRNSNPEVVNPMQVLLALREAQKVYPEKFGEQFNPSEVLLNAGKFSYPSLVKSCQESMGVSKQQAEGFLSTLLKDCIKSGHKTKYWRKKTYG